MELLQLKYFCDAAQTQNFSKTAKKFLVPPSNISQTVKRLETELGTPLFDRHSNKIKLNEAGAFFYKNARSALNLLEHAEKSLKKPHKIETIKINIRITRRVVMAAIENFRKIHPEIYFVTVHNADDSSDEYDIIVTDKQLDLPYLQTKAAEENFLLAYNKNKFSLSDNVSPAELKDLPFVTMGSDNSMYIYTQSICNRMGFSPLVALQSEDPFYIRKCIELGLGISIIPELSWRGQFSKDIVLKNIGVNKREIYVYKKIGGNDYINQFHDMLIKEFRS